MHGKQAEAELRDAETLKFKLNGVAYRGLFRSSAKPIRKDTAPWVLKVQGSVHNTEVPPSQLL